MIIFVASQARGHGTELEPTNPNAGPRVCRAWQNAADVHVRFPDHNLVD
jgi:hypothetical protein